MYIILYTKRCTLFFDVTSWSHKINTKVTVYSIVLVFLFLAFLSLKTRYEVAPRSDSEESGSEFEEEVSDFLIYLTPTVEGFKLASIS